MKKNITIVCLNDNYRKDVSKLLAEKLKKHYIDVDDLIDYELISRKNVALKCGEMFLEKVERDCISRVSEYVNCVISISPDLFLANDNRYLLENTDVYFLKVEAPKVDINKMSKLEKNKHIQQQEVFENLTQFLDNTCFSLDCENLSIEKAVEKIQKKRERRI